MSAPNGTTAPPSSLPAAALEMHNILQRLQSPDNQVRGTAEAEYNRATEMKGLCLDALATLAVSPGVDQVVRALAAVLLRRSAPDLWEGADEGTRTAVKNKLLVGVSADFSKDLRKKLCDTIAFTGAPLIDKTPSQWPELLPKLFELTGSSIAYERESALYIFSQLADFLDQKVFIPHLPTLKTAFFNGLADADMAVQIAALRATCCLLNLLESSICNHFADLVPMMMRPVRDSVTAGNDDDARSCIELLIDVVESEPKFWKKDLPNVCSLMLELAKKPSEGFDDSSSPRQMALEFLVCVAEKLPTQCRRMGSFVRNVFPIGLDMMLELEDNSDWYEQQEEDDTSEYTAFDCGQESLDRIAIALGGKAVLPVAEAIIPSYLNNEMSWVHRHAALLAISQIGEGCEKQIEAKLNEVISLALHRFRDAHPRVRWAAINCIGQMCTDFGPRIQKEFHDSIVNSLIAVMDDAGNPRVQSHAAAAVINFCDEASPEIIAPYLDRLLEKLQSLLQSPHRITQEQAVTAIAAVADSAEKHFVKFYDWFMPRLKQVLSGATGQKHLRRLRGKVMECISLVGLSVGPDKFGPDAAEVMNILVQTAPHQSEDPDDPQGFYLMQAYARICRCLKQGFIQYMPMVMPGLLKAARRKPDIQVLEAPDDDDAQDDSVDGYETVTIGDKRVGIRTSVLEDKAVACSMLACFIAELGGGFYDYVEEVTQLMVPLLKFFYHDDCRTAAANCLPDLVRCVMESGKDTTGAQVVSCVQYMLPQLLEAIKGEPDVEVLVHMIEALAQIAGMVGPPAIPAQMMPTASQAMSVVLLESEARNIERENTAEQDEWDEEAQEEAELEEAKEEDLVSRVAHAAGAFLRMHSSNGFVEAFKTQYELTDASDGMSTMQIFWHRLQGPRASYERHAALCVFDDMVMYSGAEGVNVINIVLPAMRAYAVDPDSEVRQAACFGIGICAQVGGDTFVSAGGAESLPILERVVRDPVARSEAAEGATDNAVSAIMKIMEHQASCIPADKAAVYGNLVLEYLPAKADESETRVMHAALIRMVRASDTRITGDNFCNLGRILQVLVSVLGTSAIDEEYSQHAVLLIKGMQSSLPAEVLQNAAAGLNEEQRQKLQAATSSA